MLLEAWLESEKKIGDEQSIKVGVALSPFLSLFPSRAF